MRKKMNKFDTFDDYVKDTFNGMACRVSAELRDRPHPKLWTPGFVLLVRPDIEEVTVARNLITTAGDQYQAGMIAAGVQPHNLSAPTKVTGMKLGTGTTAVAKSSTGAALDTYLTGSNQAFDTGYPTVTAVSGTDAGYVVTYQVTYAAGVITSSAVTEAVIVNDSTTNATTTAANTISRVTFAAQDMSSGTAPLTVIWAHLQHGA